MAEIKPIHLYPTAEELMSKMEFIPAPCKICPIARLCRPNQPPGYMRTVFKCGHQMDLIKANKKK
jgi:hypothetical protein